ncbi:MAG: efflux RND transporter periplasmic adaptor subunit [Prevotellaceae bacterium]|jgi:HlyD family secretion protein|nr:efflux RND transporter periplasmic adaptor subunit [Prevotellaceae bacterium]
MKKLIIIISVVALAAVVYFIFGNKKTELKVVTETVVQQTLQNSVTSSGSIQPVDQILIGTQVSGIIEKIYVDFNDHVEAGQLLAELDKTVLQESVQQSQDQLTSAKSDLLLAQRNYDRTKELYDQKAETEVNLETVINRLETSKVQVRNAQSNLNKAQTNLAFAEIRSPISGIVQDCAVKAGQTVAASFNTPTLFTIANNLKNMQVQTNVDEADIGRVQLGQKVFFTVDSYPNDTFPGTVNQIRLQPTVVSNVVTYTVIIDAPNPDEKLLPGMTAYSNIITEEETGWAVPVEALRYTPGDDAKKHLTFKEPEEKARGGKVWVQTAENTFEQRQIKTGMSDGVNTIVTDGLNGGEVILLSASLEKEDKKQAAANPLVPQRGNRNRNAGNVRVNVR